MHFQAVEAPEIERGFALSQLYAEVKHDVNVFEVNLPYSISTFTRRFADNSGHGSQGVLLPHRHVHLLRFPLGRGNHAEVPERH